MTSSPHAVTPATTNLTAVLGSFPRGPVDRAVPVSSWQEFVAQFGDPGSPTAPFGPSPLLATYAVWQFFQNGGIGAWIVRLTGGGGVEAAWTEGTFIAAVLEEVGAGSGTPRLEQIEPASFNLMCIPDLAWFGSDGSGALTAAHAFCRRNHAFLLVDPPAPAVAGGVPAELGAEPLTPVDTSTELIAWSGDYRGPNSVAAALYYPWVAIADQWNGDQTRFVPPSGSVAGVFASTDVARGVWKAPAGVEAALAGVTQLADTMSDQVNGTLNVLGINCLRTFPVYGNVVWGSRTLAGADLLASDYKYVPVRRTANFIEQSLAQSLRWAVFEPNGPPLWASIVRAVETFMAGLFTAGAFGGATAGDAFYVQCDATTTTQDDLLNGIVNVQVGFAPNQPAEFVLLRIGVAAGPPPP
jgi:hypothetical protein